ncbi:hypothetical protein C9374_013540 [Naegleria lovaniensis]|uniref:DNA replication licensing factor MCM4 n=1 Tax=Naegleria lovaniensis TaxID=51637 RepID=A0AA88GZH6_NAELO|nr:uncharacterized protein C9374_013540 [Naegleria lovaniensis]KAG2392055.1 hypothetical protein C9374_013540 [Naegleria lovaniensis]
MISLSDTEEEQHNSDRPLFNHLLEEEDDHHEHHGSSGRGSIGGLAQYGRSSLGGSGQAAPVIPSLVDPSGIKTSFSKFLQECVLSSEQLKQTISLTNTFKLDVARLKQHDEQLYHILVQYPETVISIFDVVMSEEWHKSQGEECTITITVNLDTFKPMRALNPTDIDRLVGIQGMVTRLSEIIPDMRGAYFKCSGCSASKYVPLTQGRVKEPPKCTSDTCSGSSWILIHNRCQFYDKQVIKLQETPESIPEGETPHTVNLCVFDSLTDSVKPGDRVKVTAIYRAIPIRISSKQRKVKNIFKTYLDVLGFEKIGISILNGELTRATTGGSGSTSNSASLEEADEEEQLAKLMNITPQEEAEIKELAQNPNIYQMLQDSIAPGVFEMSSVKKGILCQLFGGTNKKIPNGQLRGEIHILLCGDPGVSKSQLLIQVHKIAPRGIYTSGKGSSAVGLTAYVTKDPDSGDMVLESGALVLSDLGICCIDEFDKMSDQTRSVLHEVMEQCTVSVAKAGIICTLNARTSILAAANPKESRYNSNLSIVENIQLPPTLLSRFDLIFLLHDIPDRDQDEKLAKHIISLHFDVPTDYSTNIIPKDLLAKYIAYARNKIHPVITDEVKPYLIEGYLGLRKFGSHKKNITATTRQLESLIRLSESLARMKLKPTVQREDVEEALRLVRESIFKAAFDPKTGTIDIDLLQTGRSSADRDLENLNDEETFGMEEEL